MLVEPVIGVDPSAAGVTFVDCESMDDPKLAKVADALRDLSIPHLLFVDNDPSGQKAMAQMKDPETGDPLDFGSKWVVSSGDKQIEQMLVDAGYDDEIEAVALGQEVNIPGDMTALDFLASTKPWSCEEVARLAVANGKAAPGPVRELGERINDLLSDATDGGDDSG